MIKKKTENLLKWNLKWASTIYTQENRELLVGYQRFKPVMNNEIYSEKRISCVLEHLQPSSTHNNNNNNNNHSNSNSNSCSFKTENSGCNSPEETFPSLARTTTNSTTVLNRSQEFSNLTEVYTEITKTNKRSKYTQNKNRNRNYLIPIRLCIWKK